MVDTPGAWARARLDEVAGRGLLRRPHSREGGSTSRGTVDGRPATVFSANDYLGLAAHPAVARAAAEAALAHGVGSTGSRHLSGCHRAIEDLETELCAFLGSATATVAPSGHAANLAVLGALGGEDAVILSDALNHASIVDGCRLSRARTEVYRHRDLDDLAARLRRMQGRPVIVSDTVFSVDGTRADVAGLAGLAHRHGAWLVLDEAHAVGTLGPGGRGAGVAAGVPGDDPQIVRVVTFGKALGSAGAAVCGSPEVRGLVLQDGRALIFSTAPPHPVIAATRASVAVLQEHPELVARLQGLTARLRAALRDVDAGGDAPVPIIPVPVGDPWQAVAAEAALLDRGWLVQALRPPTVPAGTSRLRLCVSAAHSEADVDGVAAAVLATLAPVPAAS